MKDDFIKLVQDNHEQYKYSLDNSIVDTKEKYKTTSKEKVIGFIKKATLVIVVVTLTAGITLAVEKYNDEQEFRDAKNEIINEIDVVTPNTNYTDTYNVANEEKDWYYQMFTMAQDVLTGNSEYDINTRIYGCISNLRAYQKDKYKDELFRIMNIYVSANPDAYSEEAQKIGKYTKFNEYLEALGMGEDEWMEYMEGVIDGYAKTTVVEDEYNEAYANLQELLDNLDESDDVTTGGR